MSGLIARLLSNGTHKPCQAPGTKWSGCQAAPSPAESQEDASWSSHRLVLPGQKAGLEGGNQSSLGVSEGNSPSSLEDGSHQHHTGACMHTDVCITCTYPRMHVVAHTGTCPDTRACLCTHTAPTDILHMPTPTHVGICTLSPLCGRLSEDQLPLTAPAASGFLLHGATCSGLADLAFSSMQSCSPSSALTTTQVGPRALEGCLMVPEGFEGPECHPETKRRE